MNQINAGKILVLSIAGIFTISSSASAAQEHSGTAKPAIIGADGSGLSPEVAKMLEKCGIDLKGLLASSKGSGGAQTKTFSCTSKSAGKPAEKPAEARKQ
jgi:hypothetical protein